MAPWTGRLQQDQCVASARAKSGGIVVYKLDRFARTLVGLTTLNELTDHRALFAGATEPLFDFTTADGRIFLQINLMMAEYFRERTREAWEVSLTHAISRGVHIAPDVPYGYAKDGSKRLVPDRRAPFVREAFERRSRGWTSQRIAEWLNDEAPPRPPTKSAGPTRRIRFRHGRRSRARSRPCIVEAAAAFRFDQADCHPRAPRSVGAGSLRGGAEGLDPRFRFVVHRGRAGPDRRSARSRS